MIITRGTIIGPRTRVFQLGQWLNLVTEIDTLHRTAQLLARDVDGKLIPIDTADGPGFQTLTVPFDEVRFRCGTPAFLVEKYKPFFERDGIRCDQTWGDMDAAAVP